MLSITDTDARAEGLSLSPYLFALANPVNFVDGWGLHPEEHRCVMELTDDYLELWAWFWLASVETYDSYVVSQTPSEEVIRHVYHHLHQYRFSNMRLERQVRDDGSKYWELVKHIDYTYWAIIEYEEWWEVNDLIGPKREEPVEVVGSAPPSRLTGSEAFERVMVNPAYYPSGLPDVEFPVGWGGREVETYYVQRPEPPGPLEQVEVLVPPIEEVSLEAYQALL